jgi:hypothetical protein
VSEKLGLKYKKEKLATYRKRDSQQQRANIKKKLKNAADTDDEDSEDTSCLCVLAHREKCGFSAQFAVT